MLAASDSTPNMQQYITIPKPGNWRGVNDGMVAARAAIQQGNLEQAESILIELLDFAPVEVKAWKLLAKVQRQLGHIEQGIASATRALQLQNNPLPEEPPASVTVARLLWEQNEYQEARQMLSMLIEAEPNNSTLLELQQQWNMEKNS